MCGCSEDCLILIPFRLPQISCFTLSLKCFFSESDSCPNVGIGPLLQFPPLTGGRSSPTNTLVFPLDPSSYGVLCGSVYSFLLVRYSRPFSAGVLPVLPCLKVYFWCFLAEIPWCTPCPPTPPPSSSFLVISIISFPHIASLHFCVSLFPSM